MNLTREEQAMLDGEHGPTVRKAMQILSALGVIYGAGHMIPVASVQVAGVSFDNLGEAGLNWLDEMAAGGGRARVLTTLNPAGMDVENWQALGISPDFARDQMRVIDAFARMGIVTTCTCTPYLVGNLPHYGEHIAWAESSAVCYANAVLGARSNREGGPSALAASLTGRTPCYGYHLDENRRPTLTVQVNARLQDNHEFGALGKVVGVLLEGQGQKPVPYLNGIRSASLENLKSFCASIATYGGAALFHMEGITPESGLYTPPSQCVTIDRAQIDAAIQSMRQTGAAPADFVSLGCPHLSLAEIAHLAGLLNGRQVTKEFWITTSRPVKQMADRMGYTAVIEASGARFAADTCCVVAPIKGRFHTLVTDSAKACYYGYAKNRFNVVLKSFDDVVAEALQ